MAEEGARTAVAQRHPPNSHRKTKSRRKNTAHKSEPGPSAQSKTKTTSPDAKITQAKPSFQMNEVGNQQISIITGMCKL